MFGFIIFVALLYYFIRVLLVILFPDNDKFDKWGCGGGFF